MLESMLAGSSFAGIAVGIGVGLGGGAVVSSAGAAEAVAGAGSASFARSGLKRGDHGEEYELQPLKPAYMARLEQVIVRPETYSFSELVRD